MTGELQGLVDALAADLGRPVGVDDRQFRVVAYSSHLDDVDAVRVASILHREASPEVTAWLTALGVQDAEDAVRVPANAAFGMASRVCIPILFARTLLGYLWLIDEPVALTADELADATRCAAELGAALYRVRLLEHDDRERERRLARRMICGEDSAQARAAATELVRGGFLATAPAYAVLVIQPRPSDGCAPAPDDVRVRVAAAAEQTRRAVAPRHMLLLIMGEQVVCVLACGDGGEAERRGAALSAVVERNLQAKPGWSAVVGVGASRPAAQGLLESHEQAQHAVRVARAVGGFDAVVSWERLGAYRTLVRLVADHDPGEVVPPTLMRLLTSSHAPMLVPTLECFLELGGDVRAAAERLYVHRSSLYGRLHRIEEITGASLRSGDVRLELHVGLRLWRLGGGATPPPVSCDPVDRGAAASPARAVRGGRRASPRGDRARRP